jgi:hypothetical protein
MQQRRTCNVHEVAAGYCDWFADGVYGRSSPLVAALLVACECCLDAGEGGLLLFAVAFDGEGDEAVDELFVGDAGGLP